MNYRASKLSSVATEGVPGMAFFKITLMRSGIGLPRKTQGVLHALGLRKRMRTVYHPVSADVAGQILKVKELVAVSEVEKALTKEEMKASRRPDPGFYVESSMSQQYHRAEPYV